MTHVPEMRGWGSVLSGDQMSLTLGPFSFTSFESGLYLKRNKEVDKVNE